LHRRVQMDEPMPPMPPVTYAIRFVISCLLVCVEWIIAEDAGNLQSQVVWCKHFVIRHLLLASLHAPLRATLS